MPYIRSALAINSLLCQTCLVFTDICILGMPEKCFLVKNTIPCTNHSVLMFVSKF
jgi:hypothetical protein